MEELQLQPSCEILINLLRYCVDLNTLWRGRTSDEISFEEISIQTVAATCLHTADVNDRESSANCNVSRPSWQGDLTL